MKKKRQRLYTYIFISILKLTVAYPHLVLVECSIASKISTPIYNREGSLVALYRYITLSINSEILIGNKPVLTSSAVDLGFESWSGQTKDYKIGICYFSAKHAA